MNNIDELKDISSESIRKNWLNHKEEIINTPYYDVLWDIFENKYKIDKDNIYYKLFKKFINNEEIDLKNHLFNKIFVEKINEETFLIKRLNSEKRKDIHKLCDCIGLHHESKPNKNNKNTKFLYIYKPKEWLWEFTEKNPTSKSKEFYEKLEIKKEIYEEKKIQKLKNKYCCICYENGYDTELFRSVYISGLYCESCLGSESDGDGGLLCEHKFEPLYY